MREQRVTIDLYDPYFFELQYVQYDDSLLIATIIDKDSPAIFDYVYIIYDLGTGNPITQTRDITYTGNVVTIDIDKMVLQNYGTVRADLVFILDDKRMSSFIFNIAIAESLGDGQLPPPDEIYIKIIEMEDWMLQPNDTYTIIIPRKVHNLSLAGYVDITERLDGDNYIPVTHMYSRADDGTITVITDVPYSGRIVMRR